MSMVCFGLLDNESNVTGDKHDKTIAKIMTMIVHELKVGGALAACICSH